MHITDKTKSPRYERDGIISYLLVAESTTGAKNITTSLVEMSPTGKQHIHEHPTEQSYYIIRGEGEITVRNEKRLVKAGDSIFIPSNTSHGLINKGEDSLVYLSASSPPFGKENELKLWPIKPKS